MRPSQRSLYSSPLTRRAGTASGGSWGATMGHYLPFLCSLACLVALYGITWTALKRNQQQRSSRAAGDRLYRATSSFQFLGAPLALRALHEKGVKAQLPGYLVQDAGPFLHSTRARKAILSGTLDANTLPARNAEADALATPEGSPLTKTADDAFPLHHVLFNIGSSTSMWKRRKEIIRTWWRPNVTHGFVWLEKPLPTPACAHPLDQATGGSASRRMSPKGPCPSQEQQNQMDCLTLPLPRLSSSVAHLKNTGTGLRDFLRHARMVLDAFRLQLPGVKWFVFLDDDTFMSPCALSALLSAYDPTLPLYLGSTSETHWQNVINSHSMAYGGAGYAISIALAERLNRTMDECLTHHAEMWGSDMRVAACVAEAGAPLTLVPGLHQCDISGHLFGLLQSHPLHPFVSLHHLEFLLPVLSLAGIPDRREGLRRLSRFMEPDPVGFLQQAVCHDSAHGNWTASIAWGYSVRVYPGARRLWDLMKVERAFHSFVGYNHFIEFPFNTRDLEVWDKWADASPHLACGLPFTLHITDVQALESGRVRSRYSRLRTKRAPYRGSCPLKISSISAMVVERPRPMGMTGHSLLRQKCTRMEWETSGKDTILKVTLDS